jgi:urease accessory protein
MYAPPNPAADELLVPTSIRADGGVRLRFERRGERTVRMELAESGGYRARFPQTFDSICEAVLINTGGGMAGGDRMRVAVDIGEGAQAVVTTQAAEKIYRSQGFETEIVTRLAVAPRATLAWLPQESILFSHSLLRRSLTVDLAENASLIACESTVFGRSAMGERMERGSLRDRWRVRRAGRLVFADDLRLEGPIEALLARPVIGGGAQAAATLLVIGADLAAHRDAIREILAQHEDVEGGAGIVCGCLVLRLVSSRAEALRRALVMLLGQVTGRALPRTWSS